MSNVTTDDVRHLAVLSNLQLSEDEVTVLTKDIGDIVNYIELLSDIDTSGVEPTYQVSGLENVWRSDEVEQIPVTREKLLALAQETHDNQVKVPKVL